MAGNRELANDLKVIFEGHSNSTALLQRNKYTMETTHTYIHTHTVLKHPFLFPQKS